MPCDVRRAAAARDRSFVKDLIDDPDDAAIVTAIIAMARGLDLCVVAEGVETEQQAAFLRSLACDLAQGFHFGRPMPAPEFALRLKGALPVKPFEPTRKTRRLPGTAALVPGG